MVLAEVVKILAEVMFQNHLYTFGGQVYRQKRRGSYRTDGDMCPGKADHVQLGQVMGGVDEEEQSHTRGVHEVYGQWQVLSLPIQDRVEMGGGGLKFREAWRLEDRKKRPRTLLRKS